MEIGKIAELASRFEITYPEVQESEKGFLVKAVVSALISGRDFTFSGLAQGKALATVSNKSLEAALSLFDGINFESLAASVPKSVTEIPTPVSEPEPIMEVSIPVSEPEPTVEVSIPVSEPEPTVEVSIPVSEPESIVEVSIPVSEPESIVEVSEPDYMALTTQEIIRLRWTSDQGKEYLGQIYGKKSRSLLSPEQLLEFYQYLRSQPTPEAVVPVTVNPEPPVAEAISGSVIEVSEPNPDSVPKVVQSQPVSEVNSCDLIFFDKEVTTDFQQVIHVSNVAIKVLGLSQDDAKAECLNLYNKRSRQLLSDPELIDYTNDLVKRAKESLSAQAAA